MIILGLTGSIGMGKSTVARMFARAGVPVFDADAEVRRLQAEDGALIQAVGARFPSALHDGVLDRTKLAGAVLGKHEELAALEAIMHPAVQAARARFISRHASAAAIVFEIPLLLETHGESEFDKVIVVSAPEAIQRQRVLKRAGMTESKLSAILVRQMPDIEKRRQADFVIETDGELSTVQAQVNAILSCLGLAAIR